MLIEIDLQSIYRVNAHDLSLIAFKRSFGHILPPVNSKVQN
jgi:hypothetical protein